MMLAVLVAAMVVSVAAATAVMTARVARGGGEREWVRRSGKKEENAKREVEKAKNDDKKDGT